MKLKKALEGNYKKTILVLFAAFSVLTLTLVTSLSSFSTTETIDKHGNPITDESIAIVKHLNSNTLLELEVAATSQKRQAGLMNRTELDSNKGMLFIFSSEQPLSFWMKDTSISLDIIFLNKDLKVISISSNTKTQQTTEIYNSNGLAQYVIETVAGWAESTNVEIGDSFEVVSIK